MLLPFDDSMAVILDDTTEVWPECENLIIAERFLHFQEHDELSKKHSGDNDNYLHFISNLLVKVHQKFYEEGCSDVKQILSDIKKSILKNTFLVLSGVINNEQQAEHNHFWQTAIQFGSVVTRDITKSTTHVIANSLGTKKTKQADMQKIPVLHLLWLHLSTSYWCRLPEDYFKFENIGQFEIQSILAAPLIRTHSQEEGQKRFKSHSSDSESDACITED